MQYEIIWICEYEIIQFTYNYEYIYIWIHTCTYNMYKSLWINYKIIITKLYLHSKHFNIYIYIYIYINYELEHYEIEYIMRYEIISIYEYEILWTRSLIKRNYIYEYEIE